MDKEISAMAKISEAMADLESDEMLRVLQWAASKYSVEMPSLSSPLTAANGSPASEETASEDVADHSFEQVADIFVAADPKSESEKVLVVGYWLHVAQGMDTIKSSTINKHLKDLGHQVSGISKKFDTLKSQSPQLAVQLRKSGSSRQARKEYKLTKAGKDYVEKMIADSSE